jgi:nucleoside-diphosphate-sugar epimerase
MEALVIGGTRNLGPPLVSSLVDQGYRVTVFHRGQTQASLPASVRQVYGDRSDEHQLSNACAGRDFDIVIDTTLYTGPDALAAARIFHSKVGRYVMLSTGQAYLVRLGLSRPFLEKDYSGPVMPAPENAFDQGDWRYGIDKRAAEDALMRAHQQRGFPVTMLRLPMVNSERDHFHRIEGYLARLGDGGAILVPDGPHLKLRHVYGGDVVRAIVQLAASDTGHGQAYNLSQDEEVTIEELLGVLARIAGAELRLVKVPRKRLESEALLPACSPFSGLWMSNLDNGRSRRELGVTYTPLEKYLSHLVDHFRSRQCAQPGYERRPLELRVAREFESRSIRLPDPQTELTQ